MHPAGGLRPRRETAVTARGTQSRPARLNALGAVSAVRP